LLGVSDASTAALAQEREAARGGFSAGRFTSRLAIHRGQAALLVAVFISSWIEDAFETCASKL